VEDEKAWEISKTRKIIIALQIYVVVLTIFLIARLPNPFLNALIPSLAFFLSTLSVSWVKTIWTKKYS
jgi:hypothetical protein